MAGEDQHGGGVFYFPRYGAVLRCFSMLSIARPVKGAVQVANASSSIVFCNFHACISEFEDRCDGMNPSNT
jgi:hypothetical protein